MTSIVAFDLTSAERLQHLAATDSSETCAAGLVAPAGMSDGRRRYVVRDMRPVPASAYLSRSQVHASLSPGFCVELANRARAEACGVVLAHTHPGQNPLRSFSTIDSRGENEVLGYFSRRLPTAEHFAALATHDVFQCRRMGANDLAQVQLIGSNVRQLNAHAVADEPAARFARQVLVFGATVQRILRELRVSIVGLGGTGSVVATELAHLGVDKFLLVDPDAVEETNLNRVVGARSSDIGAPKAEVLSRRIVDISPGAKCDVSVADIVDDVVATQILDSDFIFLCTDSHASRAVVNQIAYQYLIPSVDMGVAIHAQNGTVEHIVGRVQMLSSGLACLVCAGWIDSGQVRIEMLSPEQRRADPYIPGHVVAQPAVISLNGVVASAAITMFLSAVAALPSNARMLHYDGIRGSLSPVVMSPNPQCIVCSPGGALGRGDTWQLPTRRHASR